jgi:hypothetical protein
MSSSLQATSGVDTNKMAGQIAQGTNLKHVTRPGDPMSDIKDKVNGKKKQVAAEAADADVQA